MTIRRFFSVRTVSIIIVNSIIYLIYANFKLIKFKCEEEQLAVVGTLI